MSMGPHYDLHDHPCKNFDVCGEMYTCSFGHCRPPYTAYSLCDHCQAIAQQQRKREAGEKQSAALHAAMCEAMQQFVDGQYVAWRTAHPLADPSEFASAFLAGFLAAWGLAAPTDAELEVGPR